MQKTDRVNIYGQDSSLTMQIRLETDDTENRNTLVVENKRDKDINVTMDDNKKCYIDVQNIDVAKPVSELGLVVAQESGKTHLDKYSKDPTVRMNVLDMLSQAHKDIENSNFDNVVKAVTHNADLEMNDIQPFNDVGFHGAENEGAIDHKGFDTWQIPIQGEIIMDDTNIELVNNTIKALNSDNTIDNLTTPLATAARAKTMKPFISFDHNSDNTVANAYITVNFDDSDSSQTTVDEDLTTLNEIFASSLIKLSALQGTFTATHHRKGMGLPAPHKIGTNTVYRSDTTSSALSTDANTYLKLWYNFVSQQLVTLNAYAMSEHYNITNGLLPLLNDEQMGKDDVKVTGWDIILIDNTGNTGSNATTLFNDLEYSQNINNWQIANYIRGDTSTSFILKTNKIHSSNNSRKNDTLEVGGELVNYPSKSFVWNLSDQYVWVDEFGNVSEPVASAADANIHLKRYIVKWNNGMPSSSHLKSEDGGAVFKIRVNSEYDGNMEVELISHVNDTSYDGTTNPKKFSNIRNRKFPKANYDHLDDADKVPMIRVQVDGFPGSSSASNKSLYWLSMSQNHRFGNIIHEASKEILADSKYVHDAVSHLVNYSNASADDSSLTQDRVLQVEKISGYTDVAGNMTSVNSALDKFANGAVSGSKSNAVWFYEKSASQTTLSVQSVPEVNANDFGFGFISVGHEKSTVDNPNRYHIPVRSQSSLEYRYVVVTSYIFNEVQYTWNVILDEDSNSTSATDTESLLTIVNKYPYRFAKSSTAHFFKIEYPDVSANIPLIWLIPCKYTGSSTSIVVSYQDAGVLSTGNISDWTLPGGTNMAASLSNYIFNDPSGGTSTTRSERVVNLLSGINKHQSGEPVDNDSYDSSVAEYDNQTPLTAIPIDNMSTSSGGGGVSYYAMFLNQHIDGTNRKLYASYQIQPTQDQLGTNGVTPLNIYKNIPASSNEADPSNSVYFIEDITDSNSPGGTSLIDADGNIDFTATNLYIKCSQYDIDNKQLKTPVSVELTSNVLTVGATQTSVQSTLNLSNELGTLQAYIDSLSLDSIRNLSTIKECDIDADGNETITQWPSSGQYSSNSANDSAYSKLLYLYHQLGLHLEDSTEDTLFELAVDIWNIDQKWHDVNDPDHIPQPNITDYKRATNNQRLKIFSNSGDKLFDNQFEPDGQNTNGYNSGQLFAIESENLLSTCQDVCTQLINKATYYNDILVKGHDQNADGDAWDSSDTLGYLWLQEKFSDFMTVMEEVTKSQMESWIELSIAAANSGTNMSLQNILEEFKTKINNIISNFMNTYNIFIAYLYEEYGKYLKLLEQHHDNIIFHDTLAKGIENIALDNGQDANVVTYDPAGIPSGFTNGGFFKSNSTNAWITSSTQVEINSTQVDLTNNFSVGASDPIASLAVVDMPNVKWATKYKLLEPTDSIMQDFVNDLNLTTGDTPSYDISVKASLTEDGLINASAATTLTNFKYLQVTFTDNGSGASLPEKIYVLLSITATYHNNLYKVTLNNNVVSVNDAQVVTIDSNTYKVVGNTSRSESFVVFSDTDISGTSVSINLSSHTNISSIDTTAVQGIVTCDIEKYETQFSFPNNNTVAFNNMSSQYLTCCSDTNNNTIMNTKWNDTDNVFNVTGRYSSIVIDPTGQIQTAINTNVTSVQSTITPVTTTHGYDTTITGVIDASEPALNSEGTLAARDMESIDISNHSNLEMFDPEAKAFSDMVSDGLNVTIVAIHIVYPTKDYMNYDQTQSYPDTVKIGYTTAIDQNNSITAPVDVNKQNNRYVYTLDTSNDSLSTSTIQSIEYDLGNSSKFAVILETTQNNVTTLYTMVGRRPLRNEYMAFMPSPQNIDGVAVQGRGVIDLANSYNAQYIDSATVSVSAFVIPRLSATLYTQDGTENVNFQSMLDLDVTNESDIATLLNGFLKNVLFNSDGTISTKTTDFFTGNSTDNDGTVTFDIGLPAP